MIEKNMMLLGVNVDHVATIRQARKTSYPDPVESAILAAKGGADQITVHLREDRRHVQDDDLLRLMSAVNVPINLEMAAEDKIIDIACRTRPHTSTLVPEKRQELTTEGGLDVAGQLPVMKEVVRLLNSADIVVSMFVDPDIDQIEASLSVGAQTVELHTGTYCDAKNEVERANELARLAVAMNYAHKLGLKVAAGHGLNYKNIQDVVRALPKVSEYNIGHSIVARAIFVGMKEAVSEMKNLINTPTIRA